MNFEFNDNVFQSFTELETERLYLREITINDLNHIFEVRSDKEVMKYFGSYPLTELSEAMEMINTVQNDYKTKSGIRWGIVLKDEDKLIGSCGVWRILKQHLRGEIGYELSSAHWQKGIMYEALSAVINYSFGKMNLHSIEANIDPENKASARLLEKLGFIKEGNLKESYYFDNKFTDTGIYSLIRKV